MNLPRQVRSSINKTAHKAGMHHETLMRDKLTDVALKCIQNGCSHDEVLPILKKEAERLALR